ncbi:MAG: hypothetical protein KDC71_02220 [Acidobacteria bacterium]|nr:hypothetical protein [Acidobacteriota bacterium]
MRQIFNQDLHGDTQQYHYHEPMFRNLLHYLRLKFQVGPPNWLVGVALVPLVIFLGFAGWVGSKLYQDVTYDDDREVFRERHQAILKNAQEYSANGFSFQAAETLRLWLIFADRDFKTTWETYQLAYAQSIPDQKGPRSRSAYSWLSEQFPNNQNYRQKLRTFPNPMQITTSKKEMIPLPGTAYVDARYFGEDPPHTSESVGVYAFPGVRVPHQKWLFSVRHGSRVQVIDYRLVLEFRQVEPLSYFRIEHNGQKGWVSECVLSAEPKPIVGKKYIENAADGAENFQNDTGK